jgi:hypothetical protein
MRGTAIYKLFSALISSQYKTWEFSRYSKQKLTDSIMNYKELLLFIQLRLLKQFLHQGSLFKSCIIFSIFLLVFFCETIKIKRDETIYVSFHFIILSFKKSHVIRVWMLKPLKRLRKSICGSWGPGTDSSPEIPDKNPACAEKLWKNLIHIHCQRKINKYLPDYPLSLNKL